MNKFLVFPTLVFFLILILSLVMIGINYKSIFNLLKNKRVNRIRKLTKEELIQQQVKRDLNKEDIKKKKIVSFISFIEDKLLFIKSPFGFNEFTMLSVGIGLFGFVFAYFIFDFLYMATIIFLLCLFLPLILLIKAENKIIMKGNKATNTFITNIRETAIGAENALAAIDISTKTLKEPLKSLIKDNVSLAQKGAIPIETSFRKMAIEMKNDYLLLFSIALKKQKETGSNFRDALNNVHQIIEKDERIAARNKIETKYGAKSFTILLGFYFVELIILRFGFPDTYTLMITNPLGKIVLYVSSIFVLINLVGVIWLSKS